jgi:fructose-specific phosphotransferase system IIC component
LHSSVTAFAPATTTATTAAVALAALAPITALATFPAFGALTGGRTRFFTFGLRAAGGGRIRPVCRFGCVSTRFVALALGSAFTGFTAFAT